MKLVYVGPGAPLRGGIARYGTHFLQALRKRHDALGIGFQRLYPSVLFPGQSQTEESFSSSVPPCEPLLHYAKWSGWRKAANLIEAFNPDGVILAWWVTFWAPHWHWLASHLSRHRRILFICHNVLPHEARFFDPALTRWALRPARRFIVHCEENRQQLLRWFPQAQILRREHPVFGFNDPAELSQEEARLRLGLRGRMLLFFGLVRPYKGLDLAIKALAQLGREYDDLILWAAGEFWQDEKRYRDLVAQHNLGDRVRLEPGYLPQQDLTLRIAACDGVILPYRQATGSGVLANAYAMNRPVIATATGCFLEMVKPGVSGMLCEPGKEESLAEAIRQFYDGEGPKRFAAGVAEAKAKFSWEGIVDAVEELFRHE